MATRPARIVQGNLIKENHTVFAISIKINVCWIVACSDHILSSHECLFSQPFMCGDRKRSEKVSNNLRKAALWLIESQERKRSHLPKRQQLAMHSNSTTCWGDREKDEDKQASNPAIHDVPMILSLMLMSCSMQQLVNSHVKFYKSIWVCTSEEKYRQKSHISFWNRRTNAKMVDDK